MEDDFSAYDASQGEGAHWAEKTFFECFDLETPARYALKAQEFTTGYSKWFKYTVPFTRKSGDQNTSLGNSLLNAAAHTWALRRVGVVDFRMFVMGDDNLIFWKPCDSQRVPGFDWTTEAECAVHVSNELARLGLQSKIKIRDNSRESVYCSSEFVPCMVGGRETTIMSPLVTRKLIKFGFSAHPLPKKESAIARLMANELSCKTHSLVPVARIVNAFYCGYQRVVEKEYESVPDDAPRYRSNEDPAVVVEAHPHAMDWFCAVYGVSALQVQALESFLAAMLRETNGTACLWSHPVFDQMLRQRGL
jgi:hypothetical protein